MSPSDGNTLHHVRIPVALLQQLLERKRRTSAKPKTAGKAPTARPRVSLPLLAPGATGCSFGGYHAMNFALRHPDIVTYVVSMSGAFDIPKRFLDRSAFLHPSLEDINSWFHRLIRRVVRIEIYQLPYAGDFVRLSFLRGSSDLHRNYIGGVERGERNLGLLNIVALAHALGVRPPNWLNQFPDRDIDDRVVEHRLSRTICELRSAFYGHSWVRIGLPVYNHVLKVMAT